MCSAGRVERKAIEMAGVWDLTEEGEAEGQILYVKIMFVSNRQYNSFSICPRLDVRNT